MVVDSKNKVIAKNTILLYFRMIVTLVISLYTSRVILQVLGVNDYGIYQTVGGIVGFLAFINNSLATASSRFITFSLGEGNSEKLKKTFSTTLSAHIVLAVVIVVVAESIGMWFLYNKLIIPAERLEAAVFTFHVTIITAFFSLTQIPYNACIIAHEKMNVFAYISIFNSISKLLIVYALAAGNFDRLKLYAILLCILQVGVMSIYRFYCHHNFQESHFSFCLDKSLIRKIASFSGWSLFANAAIALNGQGILILLNMFFSPAVVAARAISLQINMHANELVTNFQIAANPQIVKLYAAKDFDGSRLLLLQTTRFSYYMMLLMTLPICFVAKPMLELWLGIVPEYTVVFLQLILVQSLFQVFDTSFYRALYAKGQLRENALISPSVLFVQFPVVYIMFKLGFSPIVLSWASLISYAIIGLIIKPILVIRIVNYTWSDILSVFLPCIKVTMSSLVLSFCFYYVFQDLDNTIISFFCISITCVISVISCSWLLGMDVHMRRQITNIFKNRLQKWVGRRVLH